MEYVDLEVGKQVKVGTRKTSGWIESVKVVVEVFFDDGLGGWVEEFDTDGLTEVTE